MKTKSVQSIHPCQSVIQTMYDIIKAHGGEIIVNTKPARAGTNRKVKEVSLLFSCELIKRA